MPGDEETEVTPLKPKRAPRKRAPKAAASVDDVSSAPVKRAPRKRAPRKPKAEVESGVVEREVPAPAPVRTTMRKAPTPIATEKASRRSAKRQMILVATLIILGLGGSAAVGFTDKGRIDINQLITERNRKIESGELHESIIPVQNRSQEVDGGLIPVAEEAAPQVSGVASTTASSTEATASSTGNIPTPPEEIVNPVTEEAPTIEPAAQ